MRHCCFKNNCTLFVCFFFFVFFCGGGVNGVEHIATATGIIQENTWYQLFATRYIQFVSLIIYQSWNQNLNAYYTLNEKHIFSLEAQHKSSFENPFYGTIRGQQPFSILPVSDAEDRYNIRQSKETRNQNWDVKAAHYWVWNKQNNIQTTLGFTQSTQSLFSQIEQQLDNGAVLSFNQPIFNTDAR